MKFIDVIIKSLLRVKNVQPLGATYVSVQGGVQVADVADTASASNVGTFRYRKSGTTTYVDVVLQTGATTYAWTNVVTATWT